MLPHFEHATKWRSPQLFMGAILFVLRSSPLPGSPWHGESPSGSVSSRPRRGHTGRHRSGLQRNGVRAVIPIVHTRYSAWFTSDPVSSSGAVHVSGSYRRVERKAARAWRISTPGAIADSRFGFDLKGKVVYRTSRAEGRPAQGSSLREAGSANTDVRRQTVERVTRRRDGRIRDVRRAAVPTLPRSRRAPERLIMRFEYDANVL